MADKTELRKAARARREDLARAVPDFAARLATHANALAIAPGEVVGAYAALPHEADPHLLLKQLVSRGATLAFPRVHAKGQPLVFHHRKPGRELVRGAFGILEPAADWPVAHPGVLLVPLLAFDGAGHRLGYGGGFYDRTIEMLRSSSETRVIGVAYAGQEVEAVPHEPHDIAVDAVLTEDGLRGFRVSSR
ncbi:MAG TPA: 5-formyltetrahydrofolate cyclo-ligase [Rhizomicrobium sp.]|jgi:5-formyltetrahydrofolate cyclo-ligase|nr:5-formyltetrahydrofolate cyclo-ligase [Rhizomicrobium sp.]